MYFCTHRACIDAVHAASEELLELEECRFDYPSAAISSPITAAMLAIPPLVCILAYRDAGIYAFLSQQFPEPLCIICLVSSYDIRLNCCTSNQATGIFDVMRRMLACKHRKKLLAARICKDA